MSKIFELEIDGKTVGFRFNMLALGEACRLEGGISMTELFDKLGLNGKQSPDIVTLMNFFYAAAINYNKGKKIEVDFTAPDVSDWIDHYGLQASMNMMIEALKSPDPKNTVAPENQTPGL